MHLCNGFKILTFLAYYYYCVLLFDVVKYVDSKAKMQNINPQILFFVNILYLQLRVLNSPIESLPLTFQFMDCHHLVLVTTSRAYVIPQKILRLEHYST